MRENKPCPNEEWEQMPTEELDSILQAELEKEHPDEEVVLPILHIIESREKDFLTDNPEEVITIRNKLSERSTFPAKKKPSKGWIAGIAAVAAVACIVIMAIPKTVGAESLFDVLFRWTSSIFEFVDPNQAGSQPQTYDEFSTDHPGLQKVYEKLSELGAVQPVVPMWIPDDFELSELKEVSLSDGDKIKALFRDDECVISLSYRISIDAAAKFEKEKTGIEVFEVENVEHIILINDNGLSVTWLKDNIECSLNTNISKNEVYKIITSIYRSEQE